MVVSALARRPQLVAGTSFAVDVVMVVAKLAVGLLTGSLGILSEAAHSLLDGAASGFAMLAVRTAAKPADRRHPWGHGRTENLAAFTEGLLLVFTALGIAYAAVNRLLTGSHPVNPAWYAIALLVAGMLIETVRAWLLRAVTLMDLTTLAGDDTPGRVRRLCAKARRPVRQDLLEAISAHDLH